MRFRKANLYYFIEPDVVTMEEWNESKLRFAITNAFEVDESDYTIRARNVARASDGVHVYDSVGSGTGVEMVIEDSDATAGT